MKNLFALFTFFFLVTLWMNGQSKYASGMQQALGMLQEGKPTEAIALFERIGQVEKENWIPLYHAANVLITSSFEMKDATAQNNVLEKAKGIIAEAHGRSENNAELLTLEGMLYTGYLNMDPATYGMTLSPKVMELHSRALAIDPENPRVLLNSIEFQMGTAQFFGQDTAPFCEKIREIIPKFDQQPEREPFAPTHGKDRALYHIKSCDE